MSRLPTLLFLIILGAAFSLYGQQNKALILFEEHEYDFGTFRESDGIVSHTFSFINNGDLPLIINNVSSSCGCAVPSWPQEPVIPGSTGLIRVDYNPKDRPGSFTRSVAVSSNAETPVVNLVVRGVVIPVDLIREVYRYAIGDLRLETIYAAFSEIFKGDISRQNVRIYNSSPEKTLRIVFPNQPAHIKVSVKPEILEPLQEGIIEMVYLSDQLNDWDYIVDRLDISINGEVITGSQMNTTANIREDFSKLTADDLSRAPVAGFDSLTFDFGNINQDTIVKHDFILTNLGKDDLYIRKISASCGCTAVQPEEKLIRSGDATRITAVFNPSGQGGSQRKAITVITNDPKHYKTILWIQGVVEVAQDNTH